jgi:parallel beta-helix repeat protein
MAVFVSTSACGAAGSPSDGCTVVLRAADGGRDAIQEALGEAEDGATICLSGTFDIRTDRLSASGKRGLTLKGIDAGHGVGAGAVLDFHDVVGPNGLKFAGMKEFTLADLTVQNVAGDAIEVRASEGVTLRGLRVTWTRGVDARNGNYGLYPVESRDVLVEGCEASYTRDAGIYAGQSERVVIRDNRAYGNILGIQLENTRDVEVASNELYDNTAGLAVIDLPLQPAGNGGGALVVGNTFRGNNFDVTTDGVTRETFAHGVGVYVIAHDRVEIRGNTFSENVSAGVIVLSFRTVDTILPPVAADPHFDPDPSSVYILGNRFADNGAGPAPQLRERFGLVRGSDVAWDGVAEPGARGPARGLCVRANDGGTFVEFDGLGRGGERSDASAHDCELPALAPVQRPT